MSAENLFSLANLFAMIGWVMLLIALFLERDSVWQSRLLQLSGRIWPLVLSLAYLVGFVTWISASPDNSGFDSLAGVAALFTVQELLLVGWLHYLAFDLFVGRWIFDDASMRVMPRWPMVPVLLLTFMLGPVGLLTWFCIRRWFKARTPSPNAC